MPIKRVKRQIDLRDCTFGLNISKGTASTITEISQLSDREIVDVFTISTSNITLSGNQTINGATTIDDSPILVNGQTDKSENGIYTTSSSTWNRISNNLNDIKLVKVVDGDFNTYIYTLLNEPVEVEIDDIEYIPISNKDGQFILSKEITFTGAELNAVTGGFVSLFAGLSGKSYDIISAMLKVVKTSASASGYVLLGYENATNEQFKLLEEVIEGTATEYYKLLNNPIESIEYNLGDDFGLFQDPTFSFLGAITLTLTLTYRII